MASELFSHHLNRWELPQSRGYLPAGGKQVHVVSWVQVNRLKAASTRIFSPTASIPEVWLPEAPGPRQSSSCRRHWACLLTQARSQAGPDQGWQLRADKSTCYTFLFTFFLLTNPPSLSYWHWLVTLLRCFVLPWPCTGRSFYSAINNCSLKTQAPWLIQIYLFLLSYPSFFSRRTWTWKLKCFRHHFWEFQSLLDRYWWCLRDLYRWNYWFQ